MKGSNWAEITQPVSGSAMVESQFIRFQDLQLIDLGHMQMVPPILEYSSSDLHSDKKAGAGQECPVGIGCSPEGFAMSYTTLFGDLDSK